MEIKKYLIEKGVKPHLKGFDYLVTSIALCTNKKYLWNITRELYPEIAKRNDDTPSRVERAIRHAIELTDCKMCNSEFIARAIIDLELTGKGE